MAPRRVAVFGVLLCLAACGGSADEAGDGDRGSDARSTGGSAMVVPSSSAGEMSTPPASTGSVTRPPPPTTSQPASADSLLSSSSGVRWIAVASDGARWPFGYVAYLELNSSGTTGPDDPLAVGNDGCNEYRLHGTLDGDRLALSPGDTTDMWCGPGTGAAVPLDGDRLRVSDDGSTLDVIDDSGRSRLTYLRRDRFTTPPAEELIGSWRLDPDEPDLVVEAAGTMTFGSCRWTWSLAEQLTVSGFPPDPFACLGQSTSHASSRLVEMFVDGPVDVGRADSGDVYLIDDHIVIRLTA